MWISFRVFCNFFMSKIDLDKTWLEVLENEFSMDYMLQIKSKLKDLSKAGTVVCPHPKIFFEH